MNDFLYREFISKGNLKDLERLWLTLEFPEYCRYKEIEWYGYSVELTYLEEIWIQFMKNYMKDIVPEECILKSDLGCIIRFQTITMRVRDLIYQAYLEWLYENESMWRDFVNEILNKLGMISREAKQLALVMYLDGDIVKDGKLILFNTFLETIYMPTIKILFRKEVNEERLKEAVTELIKTGLIAHCSWRFHGMLCNEYVIPPFIHSIWRELPKHLDIVIPKVKHVELELRKHIHDKINSIMTKVKQFLLRLPEGVNIINEFEKDFEELKKLIDKLII